MAIRMRASAERAPYQAIAACNAPTHNCSKPLHRPASILPNDQNSPPAPRLALPSHRTIRTRPRRRTFAAPLPRSTIRIHPQRRASPRHSGRVTRARLRRRASPATSTERSEPVLRAALRHVSAPNDQNSPSAPRSVPPLRRTIRTRLRRRTSAARLPPPGPQILPTCTPLPPSLRRHPRSRTRAEIE